MRRLRALAGRLGPLGRYMVFSVIATGVDAGLGWFLHLGVHMPLAAANTAGMIAGFLVHYLLASKSVIPYRVWGCGICHLSMATFILGVVLGDILITLTDAWLRGLLGEPSRFHREQGRIHPDALFFSAVLSAAMAVQPAGALREGMGL